MAYDSRRLSSRDETMNDTFGDIDVLASLLSSEAAKLLERQRPRRNGLPSVVPDHALKARRTIRADRRERLDHGEPASRDGRCARRWTTCSARRSRSRLSATGPGHVHHLSGNIPAIATVRNLPRSVWPGRGGSARRRSAGELAHQDASFVLLVGAAGVVLSGISAAYFWQAWRARHADQICDKVRKRLDTALSRGRCGLWDWDIARGQIYWSEFMYEMLGYDAAERVSLVRRGQPRSSIPRMAISMHAGRHAGELRGHHRGPRLPRPRRARATGSGCAPAPNWFAMARRAIRT